jgi:hypothetical protein
VKVVGVARALMAAVSVRAAMVINFINPSLNFRRRFRGLEPQHDDEELG